MSHPHSRGHRRKLRAHVIDRRVKQRPSWFDHYTNSPEDQRALARSRSFLGDAGALCSCHMCGNPRRHRKERTLAEHRADLLGREWEGHDTME